jgi:hypothetical protein
LAKRAGAVFIEVVATGMHDVHRASCTHDAFAQPRIALAEFVFCSACGDADKDCGSSENSGQ